MECAEVCDGMLRCVVSGELVSVLLAATTGLRPLCRKKMAFWSAGPKCGGLAEISGLTPRRINVNILLATSSNALLDLRYLS